MIKNIANTSLGLAKVAGKGVLKHVVFIGFSMLVFIIAVFMVISTNGAGLSASGHTGIIGAIAGVFYLFTVDFWPMLLCATSLVLFPFIYFTLINKGIIHAALFQLWEKNLKDWFLNKIREYTDKYLSNDNTISNLNDKATLRLKLVSEVKNDRTNSGWQKKVLSFVMKKIKLDDFDTNDPNLKLSDYLLGKATTLVEDLGKPSNKPLFTVFGIHIILIILAVVFNN